MEQYTYEKNNMKNKQEAMTRMTERGKKQRVKTKGNTMSDGLQNVIHYKARFDIILARGKSRFQQQRWESSPVTLGNVNISFKGSHVEAVRPHFTLPSTTIVVH